MMNKDKFTVIGKNIINSSKGTYYMIHVNCNFSSTEKENGSSGFKAVTAMVDQNEYNNISLGTYEGYISQSGRYYNFAFDKKVG